MHPCDPVSRGPNLYIAEFLPLSKRCSCITLIASSKSMLTSHTWFNAWNVTLLVMWLCLISYGLLLSFTPFVFGTIACDKGPSHLQLIHDLESFMGFTFILSLLCNLDADTAISCGPLFLDGSRPAQPYRECSALNALNSSRSLVHLDSDRENFTALIWLCTLGKKRGLWTRKLIRYIWNICMASEESLLDSDWLDQAFHKMHHSPPAKL